MKLATWREMLDGGRGMDYEDALAATAAGLAAGDLVSVTTARGSFALPLEVPADMVTGTIWVPTNAPGMSLGEYGVLAGDAVQLNRGGVAE